MTAPQNDAFGPAAVNRWRPVELGSGRVQWIDGALRLAAGPTAAGAYSNAQIDDCRGRPRDQLLWSPPLRLTVRARLSHPGPSLRADCDCDFHYPDGGILTGTAGFGFWNAPSMVNGRRLPALPRALWFFYASPPSNMKLAGQAPGCGWKAATFDASGWPFRLLAPTAPVAIPLMRWRAAYRRLWPIAQRAIGVSEAPLAVDMAAWHTCVIEWEERRVRFLVDGATVLDCDTAPRGPLGLVIWLDNQSLVLTPQGRLRHRLLSQPRTQWMDLALVHVER